MSIPGLVARLTVGRYGQSLLQQVLSATNSARQVSDVEQSDIRKVIDEQLANILGRYRLSAKEVKELADLAVFAAVMLLQHAASRVTTPKIAPLIRDALTRLCADSARRVHPSVISTIVDLIFTTVEGKLAKTVPAKMQF